MLTYTPGRFRIFYAWSYLFLVRYLPWIWQFSYDLLDGTSIYRIAQPLRRWWNLRITKRFIRFLKDRSPDVVIAAHFLPADVCSAGKRAGWLTAQLVVVVTDLYPHHFWISPEADAMVVSTAQGAEALQARGVHHERIHVLGIPIDQAFHQPVDREQLRQRFQLQPQRMTLLVTSGGTTVGRFEQVVELLLALEATIPGRLQLLVVCGQDEAARVRLTQRVQTSAMPMHVFGFVDYMAQLMGISDLIVAKAGGLTISEALGRGLPLVLYHVIPGQERMNARFVCAQGAGLMAQRPEDVADTVRQLLEDPTRLAAMRAAAERISAPDAATHIASRVVQPMLLQRAKF